MIAWSITLIVFKVFRWHEINYINIPKYPELVVSKIWNYAKQIPEISIYFPDYNKNELPERQYMFDILYTLKPEVIADMIQNARKKEELFRMMTKDKWLRFIKTIGMKYLHLSILKGSIYHDNN